MISFSSPEVFSSFGECLSSIDCGPSIMPVAEDMMRAKERYGPCPEELDDYLRKQISKGKT